MIRQNEQIKPQVNGRVLVVDDNANSRRAVVKQLESMSFCCASAQNGVEGLQAFRSNEFDVVLVDLFMPNMDGMAFLKNLQQRDTDVVPIVLTAHGEIDNAIEAMKLGAFDFLLKPSEPEEISAAVQRALRHKLALREAREMKAMVTEFEFILDCWPDIIVVVDVKGRIVRVNRAAADVVGTTKNQVTGQLFREIFPNCSKQLKCFHPAKCIQATVKPKTFEFYHEQWEHYIEITAAPLISQRETTLGLMYIARNIDERKQFERNITIAHEATALLLASISSVLVGVDQQGHIIQWNATAERTFGIPVSKALDGDFRKVGIEWKDSSVVNRILTCSSDDTPTHFDDVLYLRPDGKSGFLDITVNPVIRANGRNAGFLLLARETTERKNLEFQLTQAQKLEAIGQLAAGIAHEINTPTQYVGDNTRFLQDSFRDLMPLWGKAADMLLKVKEGSVSNDDIAEIETVVQTVDLDYLTNEIPQAIKESLEGIERVTTIVQAMKEFSHPGGEEKTLVDINRSIESTITVARNEWKYVADLETDLSPGLPPMNCYPGDLNQVILNLIVNAAHAIGDVISKDKAEKGRIVISTRSLDGWVEIRVSDTGSGIPEEIQNRIFDPFFTTKEVGKGTGQGLSLARTTIVEKHHGRLTFETEKEKGTTFIIRLPVDCANSQNEATK